MPEKKRILISAYAFSPYQGSECAVGWNLVTRLANVFDVTVLYGDLASSRKMKGDLDRYFRENPPIPGLTVQYVEADGLTQLFEKIHTLPGCWMVYYVAYNLWQKKAFKVAKALHARKPFELAHQLNMIGFREPGYLWRLPIPFVWGPVGGSPNESLAYWSLFSVSGCVGVFFRTVVNEIQKRLAWRSKRAARKASLVWAVTPDDVRTIRDLWKVPAEQMLETGATVRDNPNVRTWASGEPLRIVWSGIHIPRKALPILLHAVSAPDIRDRMHIDVLGAGVETNAWKALAHALRISESITWRGMLPREQAFEVMNGCHVLAFPSLKEGTPHVVLEALSLGLPVICHDICGMGAVIDESCGEKILLKDCKTSIDGMRRALRSLLSNPQSISDLSEGALRRARELSWDVKVQTIVLEYERLIACAKERHSAVRQP